jgi:hypothetical protein
VRQVLGLSWPNGERGAKSCSKSITNLEVNYEAVAEVEKI